MLQSQKAHVRPITPTIIKKSADESSGWCAGLLLETKWIIDLRWSASYTAFVTGTTYINFMSTILDWYILLTLILFWKQTEHQKTVLWTPENKNPDIWTDVRQVWTQKTVWLGIMVMWYFTSRGTHRYTKLLLETKLITEKHFGNARKQKPWNWKQSALKWKHKKTFSWV